MGLVSSALEVSIMSNNHRYAIAIIAYLVVVYQVLFAGRRFANTRGTKVSRFFSTIAIYTLVVYLAYPIIWALAEGSHVLGVNQEIIAYAVLDVLAKGVFGAWLLFTYRSLPESHVEVDGFWGHGFNSEGRIRIDDDGA
jgi:bacteriorhodopsin